MTQEDKELLLKDLSSRLPYGVIINTTEGYGHLCSINQTIFGNEYGINIKATKRDYFNDRECNIKPYLRPMSSMTEEEINEFHKLRLIHINYGLEPLQCVLSVNEIDWLNKKMFDYRGLIPKGLAIAVTKDNNPYNI